MFTDFRAQCRHYLSTWIPRVFLNRAFSKAESGYVYDGHKRVRERERAFLPSQAVYHNVGLQSVISKGLGVANFRPSQEVTKVRNMTNFRPVRNNKANIE